jgi:hypothetical protein
MDGQIWRSINPKDFRMKSGRTTVPRRFNPSKLFETPPMTDEFTRRIFRIILANAAQSREFTEICETTLEILLDVVIDRLSDMARSASSVASHCGRTDTNGLDLFAALERYNETPDSLSQYLRRPGQLPPFDYLIDPYPLPRVLAAFAAPPVPFRANTTFVGGKHIPPFFPPFPRRDTDAAREDSGLTAAEEARRAEGRTAAVKQALWQLSAGRGAVVPHAIHFDSELTKLMTGDLLSTPTALLKSPIYNIEGTKGRDNPEMLALREAAHTMFFSTQTADIDTVLQPFSANRRRDAP